MRSPSIWRNRALSSSRSGEPGAYARTGSLCGGGGRKSAAVVTVADCRLGQMRPMEVRYLAPSWGVGRLWLDGMRLLAHELPTPSLQPSSDSHPLAARMRAYFERRRVDFDDVDLDLEGETEFGGRLAAALRAVPYGDVVTYAELAALAGRPGAQRAAGTFCARNRFPLVLPCHRVVAAHGLGGYGSLGVEYKRRLLALERGL